MRKPVFPDTDPKRDPRQPIAAVVRLDAYRAEHERRSAQEHGGVRTISATGVSRPGGIAANAYSFLLIQHLANLSDICTEPELQAWMEVALPDLLQCGVICLHGMVKDEALLVDKLVRYRFPEQEFARHIQPCTERITEAMRQWLRADHPVFVAAPQANEQYLPMELRQRPDTSRLLMICEHNALTGSAAIVSFALLPNELQEGGLTAMRLIATHLHAALTRCRNREAIAVARPALRDNLQVQMTRRESEVLHWMMLGKSNWSISVILGCGESTVKSHLKSIFVKLGVTSRVQATQVWTKHQALK